VVVLLIAKHKGMFKIKITFLPSTYLRAVAAVLHVAGSLYGDNGGACLPFF
jgi:hypothetical protein